jgi:zinc protease
MINYEKFTLANGLRVLFHHDANSPMAVVNTLYDVGARDESPEKTGFAHLFEHLMFGGSVNIPDFDGPLQRAGGQSNAFTSNDITNYYDVLPAQNIETALWLESDRMLSLAFTDKSLEVQRNVVIEEFKQRYLNQPYGDVWLNLRPLAYKVHPYQWATIGKEIAHIEQATMEDVRQFFATHYHPGNAILTIAGNFQRNQVEDLVHKWYGDIPSQKQLMRNLPAEPDQHELRTLTIERSVPSHAFYYAFHMPSRLDSDYYTADLVSDILGRGKSSVLHKKLLQDKELVTEIQCYILGSHDAGLMVVSGKLNEGVSFAQLDHELWQELGEMTTKLVDERTLTKVRNKWQTSKEFGDMGLLPRAMNLSLFELLGDCELVNTEVQRYGAITPESIKAFCAKTFQPGNCSVLNVQAKSAES